MFPCYRIPFVNEHQFKATVAWKAFAKALLCLWVGERRKMDELMWGQVFEEQRRLWDLHSPRRFVNKCVRKIFEIFKSNVPQRELEGPEFVPSIVGCHLKKSGETLACKSDLRFLRRRLPLIVSWCDHTGTESLQRNFIIHDNEALLSRMIFETSLRKKTLYANQRHLRWKSVLWSDKSVLLICF